MKTPGDAVQYYRDYPLTFRLLGAILLFSSLVTLLATIFQIAMDYRSGVNTIRKRLEEVQITHAVPLAQAVWNYDDIQMNNLMKGILKLPDLVYMEIQTDIGPLRSGTQPGKHVVTHEFALFRQGESDPLGSVLIQASLADVFQRIRDRILIILASQAVKTFVVSFFILFILRQMVTRHLNAMAEFARNLDLKKLNAFLTLDRKKTRHPDELDRVTYAINQMIQNLAKAAREMETQARLQGELDAAALIQKACMPRALPCLHGFDLATRFLPAREMSGDYLDILNPNDRFAALVVADVSGKGVSAAMYANIARVLIRDKEPLLHSPARLMKALNHSLKNEFQANHFLTMAYVVVDMQEGSVTYANAGHEPLILIRAADSRPQVLPPSGSPFSTLHAEIFDQRLHEKTLILQPGDLLFAYTDGIIDAESPDGELFGEERLLETLMQCRARSAEQISQCLYDRLCLFTGSAQQTDDMTTVVLKRQP